MKIRNSIKAFALLVGMLPFYTNHAANYESLSLINFEKPIKGFSPYFEKFRVKVVEGTGIYGLDAKYEVDYSNLIRIQAGSKIEVPYDEIKEYYQDQDLDENIDFNDYGIRWYNLESTDWNSVNSWNEIDTITEIDSQYIDARTHTLTVPLDSIGKRIGLVVIPQSKTGLPRMGNPLYLWDLAFYFEQSGPTIPGFPEENPGEPANPNPPVDPIDPDAGNPDNGGDPGQPGDPNPDYPSNGNINKPMPSIDKATMRVEGQWGVGERLIFTYEFEANMPGSEGNEWRNVSATCWSVNGTAIEDLEENSCIAADYGERPEDDPALVETNELVSDKLYQSFSPMIINKDLGEVLDIAISPRRLDSDSAEFIKGVPVELRIQDNPGVIIPPVESIPSVVPGTIVINGQQQAGQNKLNFTFEVDSDYPARFAYKWELIDGVGAVLENWQNGYVTDYNSTTHIATVNAQKYLQQSDVGKFMKITIQPEDIFGFDGDDVVYSTLEKGLSAIIDNKPSVSSLQIASDSQWAYPGNLTFKGQFTSNSVSTISASTYVIEHTDGTRLKSGTATHTAGALNISNYALQASDVGKIIRLIVTPINQLASGTNPATSFTLVGESQARQIDEESNFPNVGIMSKPAISDLKFVGNSDNRYNVGDKITVSYIYTPGVSLNPNDTSKFVSTFSGNPNKDTAPQASVTRPSAGGNRGELEFTVTQQMIDDVQPWHVRIYPIDQSGLVGEYKFITIPILEATSPAEIANVRVTYQPTISDVNNDIRPITTMRAYFDYTPGKGEASGANQSQYCWDLPGGRKCGVIGTDVEVKSDTYGTYIESPAIGDNYSGRIIDFEITAASNNIVGNKDHDILTLPFAPVIQSIELIAEDVDGNPMLPIPGAYLDLGYRVESRNGTLTTKFETKVQISRPQRTNGRYANNATPGGDYTFIPTHRDGVTMNRVSTSAKNGGDYRWIIGTLEVGQQVGMVMKSLSEIVNRTDPDDFVDKKLVPVYIAASNPSLRNEYVGVLEPNFKPTEITNLVINGGSTSNLPNSGSFQVTHTAKAGEPAVAGEMIRYEYKFWRAIPSRGEFYAQSPNVLLYSEYVIMDSETKTGTIPMGSPLTIPVSTSLEYAFMGITLTPVDAQGNQTGASITNCTTIAQCAQDSFRVRTGTPSNISGVNVVVPTPLQVGSTVTGTYNYTAGSNKHPINRDTSLFAWFIGPSNNPDPVLSEYMIQTSDNLGKIKPFTVKSEHVGKTINLYIQAMDQFTIRGNAQTVPIAN